MPQAANTAIVPAPRDAEWEEIHRKQVRKAKRGGMDVVFFGDSLTHCWLLAGKGRPVWKRHFLPLRAGNLGIGGDRTQHLLWRLQHGAAEGYAPRVIVLLIGTNNTGYEQDGITPRNTAKEAMQGVSVCVRLLLKLFPEARLLLLKLFPRGERDSLERRQVEEINRGISRLGRNPRVYLLDLNHLFLDPAGDLKRHLMPDLLHLSTEGYRHFAEALLPVVRALLSDGKPAMGKARPRKIPSMA